MDVEQWMSLELERVAENLVERAKRCAKNEWGKEGKHPMQGQKGKSWHREGSGRYTKVVTWRCSHVCSFAQKRR